VTAVQEKFIVAPTAKEAPFAGDDKVGMPIATVKDLELQ
jgi:hypothetical protein